MAVIKFVYLRFFSYIMRGVKMIETKHNFQSGYIMTKYIKVITYYQLMPTFIDKSIT